MAQKVQTVLISDLSGSEIATGGETISFAVRGVNYEIDLTDKEAAGFDKVIATYVDHARRLGGRRTSGRPGRGRADKAPVAAMRQWAKDNGYQVSDRGRISAAVQDAFHQANG